MQLTITKIWNTTNKESWIPGRSVAGPPLSSFAWRAPPSPPPQLRPGIAIRSCEPSADHGTPTCPEYNNRDTRQLSNRVASAVTMDEASFLLCYPCEREHDNPDFLDARLLSSVVLAVTPAVTMDNRSSLLLLYLHKVEQTTRNYSGAYRLLPVRFGLRVQGEPSNPTRPWRPLQEA